MSDLKFNIESEIKGSIRFIESHLISSVAIQGSLTTWELSVIEIACLAEHNVMYFIILLI